MAERPETNERLAEAVGIETVLRGEDREIRRLCQKRGAQDNLNTEPGASELPTERLGFAFSGGGIRSAAVSLGLIQAFSRSGLLRQAHYICGVSGGGYAMALLTSWIARMGFNQVNAQLAVNSSTGENLSKMSRSGFERYLEPNPIHFVRRYVSYLIPRSGLASGDTLAAAAIYLRNLLLIQAIVALALITTMAALQMIAPGLLWAQIIGYPFAIVALIGSVLLAFALGNL